MSALERKAHQMELRANLIEMGDNSGLINACDQISNRYNQLYDTMHRWDVLHDNVMRISAAVVARDRVAVREVGWELVTTATLIEDTDRELATLIRRVVNCSIVAMDEPAEARM